MLEAIEAVIGDRPFSYLGESFVGSHVGIYLAAKRPEKVWPKRLELKISASAEQFPIHLPRRPQVKSIILLSPSWPQE
jgi:hypothetical protein